MSFAFMENLNLKVYGGSFLDFVEYTSVDQARDIMLLLYYCYRIFLFNFQIAVMQTYGFISTFGSFISTFAGSKINTV